MPDVTAGPNLQRLLRPGRLCADKGDCGWLVVRRRRNQYYLYLDTGSGEVYLGRVDAYPPVPVALTMTYTGKTVVVDIDRAPRTVADAIGMARGVAEVKKIIPQLDELLDKVLAKYKLS